MAISLLFFLHLVSAASAQTASSNITLGSSLTPTGNSSWPSPSGLYAFGFFPQNTDGYAVGIFLPDKTVVWTANRDNPSVPGDVARLQLTNDGRLILVRRQGQSVEVVSPSQPIASAAMLDTGNFVLYGFNSTVIWQSFDNPTNTLLPGQRLRPEQELFSSASDSDYGRGIFRLKMQSDGNLVQYPVNTPDIGAYAYYSTGTAGRGGNVSLNLESDGLLYLFNGSVTLRNLTNGGYPAAQDFIYLMRLDVGGIFRLYSFSRNPPGNLTVMWSSTADRCNPIGICGVNAFCVQMDMVPHCQCLPGFESVQSGNNTAGCTRSFSAQGCQKIDARLRYEMIAEVNTEWENDSYESLDTPTEQACGEACLADCNCEAALFRNGRCGKQRLPLRYGRRSLNNPNMALVKVTATTPNTENIAHRKERRSDFLIVGIVLMSLSICVSAASVYLVYVNRRRRGGGNYKALIKPNLVEEISLQAFTFEDLSQSTNGFQQELGRGASGTVYKGFLQSNQKPVAVKKLEREVSQGGEREFQTELQTIGKTYHRNLVKLLGYCLDGSNKLLVFEYMSNGSLADVLFKNDRRPTWEERIKIARDISRGITYLHEECETQIIHCDIKPQNILMDEDWCAKVSDFGLAKLLRRDQTNTSTGIRGTRGYVAPEWYQKQPITVKADVYSFGVMLIEIICCKRSVDWSRGEEEAVLEQWVYDCYTAGEVGKIVGEEMVEERKVERMVKIGMWCVQYEPSLRPTMKKVLLMLEGTVDIPIPPCPSSFFSSII